jgi:NAD(P)-dependent dehydrogenase (short-subunit alcohol dehydrogenase family)
VRALLHGHDEALEQALRTRGLELVRDGEADVLVTLAPAPELWPLADLSPQAWLQRFWAWAEEPFWTFQGWARDALARRASGRWLAVTTTLGAQPFPGGGADGTASVALQTLVQVAAIEYGGRGMRANAIAAGWRADRLPAELDKALARSDTPTGRLTDPAEIATAAAWLLSDDAAHVNGEIIRLDGGYTLSRGARPDPTTP